MNLSQLLTPLRYYRNARTEVTWAEAVIRCTISIVLVPSALVGFRLIAANQRPNARLKSWDAVAVRVAGVWLAALITVGVLGFVLARWLLADPELGRPYGWRRKVVRSLMVGSQRWATAAMVLLSMDTLAFIYPSVRDWLLGPGIWQVQGLLLLALPLALLYTVSADTVALIRASYGQAHCWTCGYDLRGLGEPRCPECGLAFEREPSLADADGIDDNGESG